MSVTKPNFFIVGAAKSGTTSIFEYLRRHPDVFMPGCKDISFFGGRERREDESLSLEEYCKFFNAAKTEKRIGEASVAYLYSENAPYKIADEIGRDVKIVIILRHPVRMAYSLWGQNVRDCGETLSFEEALRKERERLDDESFAKQLEGSWIYNYAYMDRARYANQVKRYLEVFGKQNVKIYIFEKFFSNLKDGLKDLYEFLEIDTSFELTAYEQFNPAGNVRSPLVHKLYNEQLVWTAPLRALLPKPLRRGIMMKLYHWNTKKQPLPELPDAIRTRMLAEFRPSIEELEILLDTPLGDIWV